ncbi:hypothetical protein E2C01_034924 [Portunus trituberculatus]|uniref:Uncharacterized protein n=1 Tax=Portunus trituberculatus TaxID=210409 RepID=A0A5B7F7P3_PORTR|nr:hypothetical protein [Portunus trituberculatus]
MPDPIILNHPFDVTALGRGKPIKRS